jgi:signal transduction histidine kinase
MEVGTSPRIAHDFNNVLTGILGTASCCGLRAAGDQRRWRNWMKSRAAERAATLTRQLLTLARRQVVEPSTGRVW